MDLQVDVDELIGYGFNQLPFASVSSSAHSLSMLLDDLQRIVSAVMKSLSPFTPPPASLPSAEPHQLTQPPQSSPENSEVIDSDSSSYNTGFVIVRGWKWVFNVNLYMNTEWNFFAEIIRGVFSEQF